MCVLSDEFKGIAWENVELGFNTTMKRASRLKYRMGLYFVSLALLPLDLAGFPIDEPIIRLRKNYFVLHFHVTVGVNCRRRFPRGLCPLRTKSLAENFARCYLIYSLAFARGDAVVATSGELSWPVVEMRIHAPVPSG